ncbi:MAG: FkbM family methyltransferase, partial [Stellaceae bacterium]
AATGEMVIAPEGRRLSFTADFSNTAYIDYANRSAAEGYEPEVTALFDIAAPNVSVVYDIGANWGYFVAVLMSNPSFSGSVHAFEIAPRTFLDLARMVESCGLSNRVFCHAFGLSEAAGIVNIEEGTHSFLTRVSSTGKPARVDTLDRIDLPDPDLIKIDVEGHEAAVLRGGKERLRRSNSPVVFESWHLGCAAERMLEPMRILDELGYRFFRLSPRPDGESMCLGLMPLLIEERSIYAESLNILAVHPKRTEILEGFGAGAAAR